MGANVSDPTTMGSDGFNHRPIAYRKQVCCMQPVTVFRENFLSSMDSFCQQCCKLTDARQVTKLRSRPGQKFGPSRFQPPSTYAFTTETLSFSFFFPSCYAVLSIWRLGPIISGACLYFARSPAIETTLYINIPHTYHTRLPYQHREDIFPPFSGSDNRRRILQQHPAHQLTFLLIQCFMYRHRWCHPLQ
ncbi:hypothetical protein VTO42DRAFT_1136 [Malbranchea cinnamomea]